MFSGYLQATAYDNLDGKLGHSGWQWLYIVCGVISLPIGVLGYFFLPDFPETSRACFFSQSEIDFAKQRLQQQGYTPLGAAPWDRKKILRIAKHWQFWVLPFGYFLIQSSAPIQQPAFALWLKAEGRSISTINIQPTGQAGLTAAVQVLAGMLSDSPLLEGRRWPVIVTMQLLTLIGTIIIIAYYLSWACGGVPGLYYSWYPELIPHDHEMRGFVVASSNTFSFIMQIWWQLALWRTIQAPTFKGGFVGATVAGGAVILLCLVLRWLEPREKRKRAFDAQSSRDVETPTDEVSTSEKDKVAALSSKVGKV
jgi:ACS family pantothenate transporter-like MFS transporter